MLEAGFQAWAERSSGDSCDEVRRRLAPAVAALEALETDVAEVCGVLNASSGRLVAVIAQMLSMEGFATSGTLTAEQWVAWKCGVSSARARMLVAMARRVEELPCTQAAFEAGELSAEQVAVIARHAPAHIDDQVVELAKVATVNQLRSSLSRFSFAPKAEPDPDEGPVDPEPDDKTRVDFGTTDDGWWRLSALLPLDEGALVETALAAARQSLMGDVDDEASIAGDGGSRATWRDALVAMAERSLGSMAASRPHRDRHLVMVHLNSDKVTGTSARLHLGPGLPDSLRRYLGCDASVRPVITFKGQPFSVGRTQRIVPNRTRTAIEQRDGGCRVPGCERSRWLHIHHVTHWEDGGATDTSNLLALCQPHHRMHHLGKLGISGDADDPDGMVFTDSRGRVLDKCGRPIPPPRGEPLPSPTGKWAHPLGERISYRDVWFDESRAGAA